MANAQGSCLLFKSQEPQCILLVLRDTPGAGSLACKLQVELRWKPREKEDVTCDPWHNKGSQLWHSWVWDTQSQGSGRRAKASLCSGCEVIKAQR